MTNLIRSSSIALNYFIQLLILSDLLCLSIQSDVQYIKFFSDKNCSDANFNGKIEDTDMALNITPGFGGALSIRVNGLWRIHEPQLSGDKIVTALTTIWGVDSCERKKTYLGPYTIAERYGNSDLNTSEIAFNTETSFRGIRFTINATDKELALPKQIMMLSWFFTGLSNWTVYPKTDFTGKFTCLKPQGQVVTDGHGITHDWGSRLLVGSVRLGCSSTNVSIYTNPNYLFVVLTIVALFHSVFRN